MRRKAGTRAGLTPGRGGGAVRAVGRLALALLVGAHGVGAVVVDGHLRAVGAAG